MLELLSATLEEDSRTDDEDGSSLDELSTDEEDSAKLEELFSEEDDPATTSEELLPVAPSLDEDPSDSADCGVCPELINVLSVTLDEELLPRATSSLEERVASLSAGPAGESLEPSLPQALPSNAATTTIPPRTNFFII